IDEIALPILEVYKACNHGAIDKERMERYWPLAKKAIAFLVHHGPYTPQDRWEEQQGYTPFTIAASVAGLLGGAELAEMNMKTIWQHTAAKQPTTGMMLSKRKPT